MNMIWNLSFRLDPTDFILGNHFEPIFFNMWPQQKDTAVSELEDS